MHCFIVRNRNESCFFLEKTTSILAICCTSKPNCRQVMRIEVPAPDTDAADGSRGTWMDHGITVILHQD